MELQNTIFHNVALFHSHIVSLVRDNTMDLSLLKLLAHIDPQ